MISKLGDESIVTNTNLTLGVPCIRCKHLDGTCRLYKLFIKVHLPTYPVIISWKLDESCGVVSLFNMSLQRSCRTSGWRPGYPGGNLGRPSVNTEDSRKDHGKVSCHRFLSSVEH